MAADWYKVNLKDRPIGLFGIEFNDIPVDKKEEYINKQIGNARIAVKHMAEMYRSGFMSNSPCTHCGAGGLSPDGDCTREMQEEGLIS